MYLYEFLVLGTQTIKPNWLQAFIIICLNVINTNIDFDNWTFDFPVVIQTY